MFQCFARNTAGEVQTSTYLAVTSKSFPALLLSVSCPGLSSAPSQGPRENRDRIPEDCPSGSRQGATSHLRPLPPQPAPSAGGGLWSLPVLLVTCSREHVPRLLERCSGVSAVPSSLPRRLSRARPGQAKLLASPKRRTSTLSSAPQLANPVPPGSPFADDSSSPAHLMELPLPSDDLASGHSEALCKCHVLLGPSSQRQGPSPGPTEAVGQRGRGCSAGAMGGAASDELVCV